MADAGILARLLIIVRRYRIIQIIQNTPIIQKKQIKTFNIMNIQPLADRVLVRPAEAEQKTASGIIIPDTAKEKPQRGEVLAVGKGTKDHEMTVKVGDNVLYGKYSGTEIEIDGEKLMIMKESDIYAII